MEHRELRQMEFFLVDDVPALLNEVNLKGGVHMRSFLDKLRELKATAKEIKIAHLGVEDILKVTGLFIRVAKKIQKECEPHLKAPGFGSLQI